MSTIVKEDNMLTYSDIQSILAEKSEALLGHSCQTISKDQLHLPSPTFVDDIFTLTNRNNQVLRNLQSIYNHGRLAGTGYVSILPVDQFAYSIVPRTWLGRVARTEQIDSVDSISCGGELLDLFPPMIRIDKKAVY